MVLIPMVDITSLCADPSPNAESVVAYGWKWLEKNAEHITEVKRLAAHVACMSYVDKQFRGIYVYGLQISKAFVFTVVIQLGTFAPTMATIAITFARQLVQEGVYAQSHTSGI